MTTTLSVDIDDARCYHEIYGVPNAPACGVGVEAALERFAEVLAAEHARATFFVVGRSVSTLKPSLQALLHKGHELANHSYAHHYGLAFQSPTEIARDLAQADQALRALGITPQGFRAPGYTQSQPLRTAVAQCGYAYDSSALASPTYYAAKLAAKFALALQGKPSASQWRGASTFFARDKVQRDEGGMWTVPVSAMGPLRLPCVGTLMLAGPSWMATYARQTCARRKHVHLQFHALDLADARDEGCAALASIAPELRAPLHVRRQRLVALLRGCGGGISISEALATR